MKNTEKVIPFVQVKANRENIVPRISEGYAPLEKIINLCIDDNIPTIACCKGHHPLDEAYICFAYTDYTQSYLNACLNRIRTIPGIEICFGTTTRNNPFSVKIGAKMFNRDKVFKIIATCLECTFQDEKLSPDIEAALRITANLDLAGIDGMLSINRKITSLKYWLMTFEETERYELATHLKDMGSHYGRNYYLCHESQALALAAGSIEKMHVIFKHPEGFIIKANEPTDMKVAMIDKINTCMEGEYGEHIRYR